jgi:hypothetical protein
MGENSPGLYQVTAKNTLGQVVGAGGPDPDYLIAKVKAEAATLAPARVSHRANDTTSGLPQFRFWVVRRAFAAA